MRGAIVVAALVSLLSVEGFAAESALAGKRPNIVLVLTDDQGYGDLSAHGNPVLKTPHLDRLHREGVRFSDFHVSPTCSPTRSALLTGRHEFRNGVTHTILERERLTPEATTLAQALQSAGYATGIFGKWHLGDEPDRWPSRRGFDEMFIHGAGGIGQTFPGSCGDAPGNTYFDPVILHNGRFRKTQGYCTDVFFAEALRWMGEVKGRRPFFAFITPNAPHGPFQVRPEDEARYRGRVANPQAAKFLGMVANIDDNVGRLLEQLRAWDIERDTLVIFMNDNGADGGAMVYNAGMRGKKGTAFLGGTRAASLWRWPGTLQPAECRALAAHVDVFGTLSELAGAKDTDAVRRQVEGRSLLPLLAAPRSPWPERTLITHVGRWPKDADRRDWKFAQCSVRTPRWHLVSPDGGREPKWLLFDVAADYGEQRDLAAAHPEVVRDLARQYDAWWESVQPQLVNESAVGPRENPFKELYRKQYGVGDPPADQSRADGGLEKRLLAEDRAKLAADVRAQGDALRGAMLFHSAELGCVKCHAPSPTDPAHPTETLRGPDLARAPEPLGDEQLVDAVLRPSATIRKGFETIQIQTKAGTTVTGLLAADRADAVVLRDPAQDFREFTFAKEEIETRAVGTTSLMPVGLVNGLTSRGQFLDLVQYLREVAAGGPARAAELRPRTRSVFEVELPEYENHLDHVGLIGALNDQSLRRGEEVYNRVCVNCHSTRERPGTLPTSLAFASGKFKNGGDPYRMYQTVTRGFGLMPPQPWLVPQQKYDVIHYIRETFVKPYNPGQYAVLSRDDLAKLPRGDTRGPKPTRLEPWSLADYGPTLTNTYEVGSDGRNFAYKGIAVRLDDGPGGVARGRAWMVFDHDTCRVAAAWTGNGFIDWNGIHFNGAHGVHPRLVGTIHLANPTGPGWADPRSTGAVDAGGFADPRLVGRDQRRYGPLPRGWAQYRGQYRYGDKTIVSYTVGETAVLEMPGLLGAPEGVFTRTLNFAPRGRPLVMQVAHVDGARQTRPLRGVGLAPVAWTTAEGSGIVAGVVPAAAGMAWIAGPEGDLRLSIPAGDTPLRCTLWFARIEKLEHSETIAAAIRPDGMGIDLAPLTRGGGPRWTTILRTQAQLGDDKGPLAADWLAHPAANPWSVQMRFSGLDFFPDGRRAAVCTWDGDVWLVEGIDSPAGGLAWRRIAGGLFQPLGLKIVAGRIHVTCRDQLVVLRDLDGDGETDFYECRNNDHQVTDHFHEFAMGLQTDADGNFYYAKSARHALNALVPQHGTLLRISRDGSRTDILANGFRAANGVCLNPDGSFFVTDQEGHWTPKNRINHVTPGGFYGNFFGFHELTDSSDTAMKQPLCWITNAFDRSPAELLWVDSEHWGPLRGSLLNLSYGMGQVFVVPHETVNGQMQGGMVPLPIPAFPTGVMRGRFHPDNGQLYLCGMTAWATNQPLPGGFYRIRYTGRPIHVPIGLQATAQGVRLTFSGDLDAATASDPARYTVRTWSLRRSADYGSKHIDERPRAVTAARLAADRRSVELTIADLAPTRGMEIRYDILSSDGQPVKSAIHNTIHALGAETRADVGGKPE